MKVVIIGAVTGGASAATRLRRLDEHAIESDMIVLSIGVAPESTLARKAGLELGLRGSIKVEGSVYTATSISTPWETPSRSST